MTLTRYGKHEHFITHQEEPFNGGSPAQILRQAFMTPNEAFYVRAHAAVPEMNADDYRLSINGLVSQTLTLTLEDLKHYPKQTVTATLQCAGNRRKELAAVAPMPGESVMWANEAISNAVWSGASLAAVLKDAGVGEEAAHAAFTSFDQVEKDGETFGYGGSIPLEKALREEVLLAYEMNGEALLPVHGYPVRVVVPGYVAARSVKWLAAITLQTEPSNNYFQQLDYKLFPPHVTDETVDWSQGQMLDKMRSDAVICLPVDESEIQAGRVLVQGYAMPGADTEIIVVETSCDNGATWTPMRLTGESQKWVWRFWEGELELTPGKHTLIARVIDNQGTIQAKTPAELWNFKGYMNNSQHRICIYAK